MSPASLGIGRSGLSGRGLRPGLRGVQLNAKKCIYALCQVTVVGRVCSVEGCNNGVGSNRNGIYASASFTLLRKRKDMPGCPNSRANLRRPSPATGGQESSRDGG